MIYDVAIVGDGILALSTAYHLLREEPTLKVVLIGNKERKGAATIAAGAMLNCFAEVTQETFLHTASRAKFALALKASRLWPSFLTELDLPIFNQGTYVILNARNGGLDETNFEAIEKTLIQERVPYQEVDPATIEGIDPVTDFRPLRAVYLPMEGFVNPLKVLDALEEKFLRKGGNLRFSQAKKVAKQGKEFFIELEEGATVHAAQILLAAGANTQFFIDQFYEIASRIPRVLSSVGYAFVLQSQEVKVNAVIRTPLRAGSCGLHMLPYDSGKIYVGATAFYSLLMESQPKVRYPYQLLRNALHQFNQNFHNAYIVKEVVGNRPVTLDAYPLIGKTSIPGLSILTGTYRDGFHCAPLLGKEMALQILNKESPISHPFQPERSPIYHTTYMDSIEECVHHILAANYEYGLTLPFSGVGIEELIEEGLRKRFFEIYEHLGIEFSLPIEMLILFHRAPPSILDEFKTIYERIIDRQSTFTKLH